MSEGAILAFGVFVGLAFIAVGILGIYRKVKFSKSIKTMHQVSGVLVDYEVIEASDDDASDGYFPIYEYEWNGVTKQLKSNVNTIKQKRGAKVHILIDPQTEKVICMEAENASNGALLLFGVIGVLTLVLMVLIGTGVVS